MLRMKDIGRYSLLLLIGLLGGYSAMAAERVALVIGNSEYAHAPYLSNPQRDAAAIAKALRDLGFSVTGPLFNQSKAEMDTALRQFGRQAQSAMAAVVYFSGHGLELGGQNYLIPQDAVLEREKDVSLEAVALNVVLDQVSGVNGYRLVILDACRDNPLANNMVRTNGAKAAYRGLAPVEPVGQTYVAYAARAGQRSQDGEAGGNSPYATALLKYLPQPGLPLERLFGAVRDEVKRRTNGEQTPFLYGESGADPIYLAGMGPVSSPPPPMVDHDLIAWQSAEKCGMAACFQAYLKKHPRGQYAEMAQARLEPTPIPPVATTAPVEQPRQPFEPEMVAITGDCFLMGSPVSEASHHDDEKQHRVCVANFEMGRYEVTQRQWQAVTGDNPSYYKDCADCPVESVSWNDMQNYLRKLNQQTRKEYRLPTEAEWEYACRGGVVGQRYCGGDNPDQVAWYTGNSGGKTHPVGQKVMNGFGLYDMSGNVWEWTCSAYDEDYGGMEKECTNYSASRALVMRGGGWVNHPASVRSAYRFGFGIIRTKAHGFRLARSL